MVGERHRRINIEHKQSGQKQDHDAHENRFSELDIHPGTITGQWLKLWAFRHKTVRALLRWVLLNPKVIEDGWLASNGSCRQEIEPGLMRRTHMRLSGCAKN